MEEKRLNINVPLSYSPREPALNMAQIRFLGRSTEALHFHLIHILAYESLLFVTEFALGFFFELNVSLPFKLNVF
jgi:hypothetical protein